jgi:hypothetical protein
MPRIVSLSAFPLLFALGACNEFIQGGCECAANVPLVGTWSHTDTTAMVMLDTNGVAGDSGLSIERTRLIFGYDQKVTATRNLKFHDTQKHVLVMDTTTTYAGIWQTPRYDTLIFQWSTEPLYYRDTLNFNATGSTLRLISAHPDLHPETPDSILFTRE